jgi:soluble lytic murein transglycosylase-like protein
MEKKKSLRWAVLVKDISGLILIITAVVLVIASCQHTQAAAKEEPTLEARYTCFKYADDIPLSYEFQTYINRACDFYDIAPEIVFSVIAKESNYQADEIGDNGNSEGLMQVQRQHHEKRMEKLGCSDLLNPYENVLVGIDYLAELFNYYNGNMSKALTAYNAGATGAYEYYFSNGIEASEYAEAVLENTEMIKEGMKRVYTRADDPDIDFLRHDAEQQKELEKCPKCSMCDEYIQDDFLYEINDEVICEECLNDNFRKSVEDYV